MGARVKKIVWNPNFTPALANSPGVQLHIKNRGDRVIFYARLHFLGLVKHTHPVTPPPYAESFFTRQGRQGRIMTVIVGNDDPVALLVEFGAHPGGGDTFVLGYRPLGFGVDAVANGG